MYFIPRWIIKRKDLCPIISLKSPARQIIYFKIEIYNQSWKHLDNKSFWIRDFNITFFLFFKIKNKPENTYPIYHKLICNLVTLAIKLNLHKILKTKIKTKTNEDSD